MLTLNIDFNQNTIQGCVPDTQSSVTEPAAALFCVAYTQACKGFLHKVLKMMP